VFWGDVQVLRQVGLIIAWLAVQLRRAWQYECREGRNLHTALCTEKPAAFRERLRGHVAAVREWGLNAADVGVLAARDVRLVAGEPRALASRVSVLASFFKVPPILATQSADAVLAEDEHASRVQLRHLHGPHGALYLGTADLEELMANYVRLGLFGTKDAAREGFLNNIDLLKGTSWRVLVRRNAAVRAVGATAEDEMTAATLHYSAERALEAGMLRTWSGCAPLVTAARAREQASTRVTGTWT
jgi:hypothetical protein